MQNIRHVGTARQRHFACSFRPYMGSLLPNSKRKASSLAQFLHAAALPHAHGTQRSGRQAAHRAQAPANILRCYIPVERAFTVMDSASMCAPCQVKVKTQCSVSLSQSVMSKGPPFDNGAKATFTAATNSHVYVRCGAGAARTRAPLTRTTCQYVSSLSLSRCLVRLSYLLLHPAYAPPAFAQAPTHSKRWQQPSLAAHRRCNVLAGAQPQRRAGGDAGKTVLHHAAAHNPLRKTPTSQLPRASPASNSYVAAGIVPHRKTRIQHCSHPTRVREPPFFRPQPGHRTPNPHPYPTPAHPAQQPTQTPCARSA